MIPHKRLGACLAIRALITAFVVEAGRGITGLRRGFLMDSRNKLSLSRLQLLPDVGVGSSEA